MNIPPPTARTGEPCFVCFSEDGEVTGCKLAAEVSVWGMVSCVMCHVMCRHTPTYSHHHTLTPHRAT